MNATSAELLPPNPYSAGVAAYAVSLIRRHAAGRPPRLSAAAREHLESHFWAPGFVGLEVSIQRALVLCEGTVIEPRHLPLAGDAAIESERRERSAILKSLRATHGARREAAARLGIAPRTLRVKLAALRERGICLPPVETDGPGLRYE